MTLTRLFQPSFPVYGIATLIRVVYICTYNIIKKEEKKVPSDFGLSDYAASLPRAADDDAASRTSITNKSTTSRRLLFKS